MGRQRIILNNARFIGNAGFRQNEQTFDAVRLEARPIDHVDQRGLDPEALGRRHAIVIGKHSGLAALRAVCGDLGLDAEAEAMALAEIRALAQQSKRAVPVDHARRIASAFQEILAARRADATAWP